MNPHLLLAIGGGIVLAGFLARVIFEKVRIPDVILLIGLGILLGRLVPPEARLWISELAPYLGTLALVMILFEGGLEIELGQAIRQMGPALALSLTGFSATALLIGGCAVLFLGWPLLPALLLGTVLGCTSSAIVIPTAQRVPLAEKTRALVNLEAAFSDTFAIVALFVLLELAGTGGPWFTTGVEHLAKSFGVALAASSAVGLAWMIVLEYTKEQPLSYLLTFAILLLLYGGVEFLGGSGPIAVFLFGVVITEAKRLPSWLFFGRRQFTWTRQEAHETLQGFHQELTFLVRAFFFVYIGLLFERERLTGQVIGMALWLCLLIVLGKLVSVHLLGRVLAGHPRSWVSLFLPRGLVSAVLASIPVAHAIPGTALLMDYTIPVILFSNGIMAAGLLFLSRRRPAA